MIALYELWPTREAFINQNNPSRQREICTVPSRCYFGNSPSLAMLNRTYGEGTARTWLIPQIANAIIFTGVTGDIDPETFTELSHIIESERYYLKVDELMLFFWRFKAGHYGHFYKTFEPHIILNSLDDFNRERNRAYQKHEEEERQRKREEHERLHPPMTWDEYQRSKAQGIKE